MKRVHIDTAGFLLAFFSSTEGMFVSGTFGGGGGDEQAGELRRRLVESLVYRW